METRLALEEWEEALVAAGASTSSRRSYAAHVRATAAALGQQAEVDPAVLPLTAWTLPELRRALASYRTRPDARFTAAPGGERSPASMRARVAAIRSFTRFCTEEGYLREDPGPRLRLPRSSPPAPAPLLTSGEIEELRTAARAGRAPERDLLLLELLASLGCSIGEVAALDLDDWDAAAGTLRLSGKARRARTLACPPRVAEVIEAWLPVRARWLARRGEDSPALLVSPRPGHPRLSVDGLSSCLERIFARAGVEFRGSHTLRSSYAARALDAGASPRLVREVLGVDSLAALRVMVQAPSAAVLTPPVL